ncbi:hypothetical protein CRI93_10500 [Longimonas halophila]|uniref:Gingipain domain-containing protein n=1 Tax=Longimonas halophila TaxID=1469170 RepID=A0A2H3NK78_9BACT|nr:C25 family cysteine peptidase [Longimonas halophila]PEN06245.1 hypothetical protein CRI93_10500 [Longimonas halophila]
MPVSLFRFRPLFVGLWLVGVLCSADVYAQNGLDYDASWYVEGAPYVKIDVVEDGIYRVSGSEIANALPNGTSLSSIDPATLQLFERGQEVPIDVSATGALASNDEIVFVGTRNRGTDETWAYNDEPTWQSSTHRSLYTDTTTYWLTWNQTDNGRRYASANTNNVSPTTALRDTAWAERDTRYYFGRPNENGSPLYTESEGYYWHRFSHNNTAPRTFTHTLSVGRRDENAATPLDLRLRFDAETNSCHRVEVEARLGTGGSASFESLGTQSWQGVSRRTFETTVDPDRIPNDGLDLRITSYNDGFDSGCPPPASTPNYVLLDWIAADYTRTLRARSGDWQRLVLPNSGSYTLPLTGHTGTPVAYSPDTGQKATTNGDDDLSLNNAEAQAAYWVAGASGYKTPTQLRPHTGTDWTNPNVHAADYVLVVPPALEESGQAMADYRRTQGGYDVVVVPLHDIFDAFDYGRPSPVALRRFAHHTREWNTAPQFLSLWGDAQHPIYTNNIVDRTPDWSIPSFGYSPSDGWFAMQQDGAGDWSEFMAVGRIPVRTNAQGELFLDKLETYETAPLDLWQQRMMLLAGGTNSSEQQSLQFYSDRWGEWATGTEDSLYVAGMDTTRYYKRVDDALDSSLQDSLATSLQRGAGWLNYFGHSAAQTWEIVTDPPEQFNNAGRLPVVVSLGCRTGSFAGGRFEVASAPSLGEQLVVGSLQGDGTPISGSENGGIAHWGTSALGNRIPSARLNDELIDRVFRDTVRVLGSAIQDAKANVADRFGSSNTYRRHLLQYSLLGDPATEIAIAGKPDFHLTADAIRIEPASPTPDDDLTVELRLRNRGLVAHDSATVALEWTRPDGTTTTRERRVPRFAVERYESFTFELDGASIGTNTFTARIDPENAYDEAVESNNTATREQVVFDTNVTLISPIDQHTVSTRTPTMRLNLVRQGDFDAPLPLEVQVDTSTTFDSPALQTHTPTVEGALVEWTPPQPLSDEAVYYWRARIAGESAVTWSESRFVVDTERPASVWSQRGPLWTRTNTDALNYSPDTEQWAFDTFTSNVSIYSERGQGENVYGFVINGSANYVYLAFGFGILVMDGTTGEVRDAQSFPTYDLRDQFVGENGEQEEAIEAMGEFLDNVAQEGDYVFFRTRHLARESGPTIPESVKDLIRNLGTTPSASEPHSTLVDDLSYVDVWAMKAQKGNPDATEEIVTDPSAPPDERNINGYEHDLTFSRAEGALTTQAIGPASSWDALEWTATDDTDAASLQINVRSAADSTLLVSDLEALSDTAPLNAIDADAHPRIFLEATLRNETDRVPPQLRSWHVDYTGVPELILDPTPLTASPDTLQEGADLSLTTRVVNWGAIAAPETRIVYDLNDASNVSTTVAADTVGALAPDATHESTVTVGTRDRSGANTIRAQAQQADPRERIRANNTAARPLTVTTDAGQPSVRVLAEGRELPPNREPLVDLTDPALPYVSTAPSFEILVEDENPYLPLADTSLVDVYLDDNRVPYANPALSFEPATEEQPEARVLYEPDFSGRDSTYTIRVEAEDASGNELAEPYQTHVRVEQDQTIAALYPYPNPMVEHTQFAYRVQGGTPPPRNVRLRIYTVSGRLVRELQDSPNAIGWNQFRWNGRDADGDRVATGVYLYRVRMDTENGTHEGDVGKVVVIR